MRLDLYLTNHHNFTRNKAQQLIVAGLVSVNGIVITKSSFDFTDDNKVEVSEDRRVRWVSRSAEKLAGFLENWTLEIQWKSCLDVGSSTGGFTQVLLEYSASHVDAVDVWTDQLHETLRNDPRVTSYEQTDIRNFSVKKPYDIIVWDASFISLHEILPSILLHANSLTDIILLYKPQFEVGRENLRKTGVPKDEKVVERGLSDFEQFLGEQDCVIIAKAKSTLIWEAGNQEWIFWIKKS